jgi:effector-binding domain-containing protein
MSFSKIIKIVLALLLLGIGAWYFFIKDYNYKITFKTRQLPGIVYSNIVKWNDGKPDANKVVITLGKTPFSEIQQELRSEDTILKYHWLITKEDDSTSLVTVKIKDEQHSLKQNFQTLFFKNDFVKNSISKVKQLGKDINNKAEFYKLSSVTNSQIPSFNCAYMSLESKVQDKAMTMLKNIEIVMNYLRDNDIELINHPFLEITKWDVENDSIQFNFCFPISEMSDYPKSEKVKIKKTDKKEALKIDFNGNYRDSDNAWYGIIDYAKTNNININMLPFEVYLNDPHQGGNSLEWKAEVYMQIAE